MAQEQNQPKNTFEKSGDNFRKAQHKNEQDWARQSRKGAAAMGGQKTDSQGNPRSDSTDQNTPK